jgi:hypothetical protein
MPGHAERVWLGLVGLTLAGFFLAETGHPGWTLTLAVVLLVGLKSRLLIRFYMELGLGLAHRRFAGPLYLFIGLILLVILLSHSWGPWLARLTGLDS